MGIKNNGIGWWGLVYGGWGDLGKFVFKIFIEMKHVFNFIKNNSLNVV